MTTPGSYISSRGSLVRMPSGRRARFENIERQSRPRSTIGFCSGVDADEAHIAILQRALDDAHPVPRTKSAPPRTSARKRLTISESEREGLVFYLAGRPTVTCRLLVGLIGYGPILGLRPHEWVTARISGDILIVTCAKHTNGRGVASEREIDLTALSGEQRRGLDRFLARLQIEAAKCAAWQIFHERLAKALNSSLPSDRHSAD